MTALDGWQQRQRWMFDRRVDEPRLTNEYRDLVGASPMLVDIAAAVSLYCGVPYDGIWMIMRGRCQRDWRHCVPKQRTPAGARVSLNFTSTHQASR